MKITRTVTINKPANEIWHLIAHDFDKAYLWMGPIPRSVEIGNGRSPTGAPMEGRMCDLSDDPDGAKVREIITDYNETGKSISFDVNPVNNPAVVPLKKNHVQMTVVPKGPNKSEVVWVAQPELKVFAYLLYPVLRLAMPFAFDKLLAGLKTYSESNALKAA